MIPSFIPEYGTEVMSYPSLYTRSSFRQASKSQVRSYKSQTGTCILTYTSPYYYCYKYIPPNRLSICMTHDLHIFAANSASRRDYIPRCTLCASTREEDEERGHGHSVQHRHDILIIRRVPLVLLIMYIYNKTVNVLLAYFRMLCNSAVLSFFLFFLVLLVSVVVVLGRWKL